MGTPQSLLIEQSTPSNFQWFPPGQVAQLVEQRIENPRVGSSILPLATMQSVACPDRQRPCWAAGERLNGTVSSLDPVLRNAVRAHRSPAKTSTPGL
jgi:hypothetical protein